LGQRAQTILVPQEAACSATLAQLEVLVIQARPGALGKVRLLKVLQAQETSPPACLARTQMHKMWGARETHRVACLARPQIHRRQGAQEMHQVVCLEAVLLGEMSLATREALLRYLEPRPSPQPQSLYYSAQPLQPHLVAVRSLAIPLRLQLVSHQPILS